MIRIAVVDDEIQDREQIQSHFHTLAKEVREELVVISFSSGQQFLQQYDYSYDLVCLDIDMPKQNGISVAQEVRRRDDKVILIFITNLAQMAIQGYSVRALDFIVKPITYSSFALKMKSALQIIANRKSVNIVLTTAEGVWKIPSDQLYYAEIRGHYLYYHTVSGTFQQKAPLVKLEEKLAGLSFQRCNQCYLINLKHVSAIRKDEILVGGQWLKVSRPRRKQFLEALANYMGGVEQ